MLKTTLLTVTCMIQSMLQTFKLGRLMRIQSRLISQFDEESRARAKDQEMETIDKGIADALHEAASLTGAMIQREKAMLNPQPMYEASPPSEDFDA